MRQIISESRSGAWQRQRRLSHVGCEVERAVGEDGAVLRRDGNRPADSLGRARAGFHGLVTAGAKPGSQVLCGQSARTRRGRASPAATRRRSRGPARRLPLRHATSSFSRTRSAGRRGRLARRRGRNIRRICWTRYSRDFAWGSKVAVAITAERWYNAHKLEEGLFRHGDISVHS